jgi:hypothetical protein
LGGVPARCPEIQKSMADFINSSGTLLFDSTSMIDYVRNCAAGQPTFTEAELNAALERKPEEMTDNDDETNVAEGGSTATAA